MNIIDRGTAFLQRLQELAGRTAWEWRRCPHCGEALTCKWGSYTRRPWTLAGRQTVRVPRHRCERCQRTYAEQSPWLVRGSWYAREVHRCAIDHWQHLGTSVRRTAEVLRSWLGKQERWGLWRPLDRAGAPDDRTACHLHASTVERWLDRAGQAARQSIPGQLAGVPTAGQCGTDGLWARLHDGSRRVLLLLTDCVTGVVWPPVVATGEAAAAGWGHLVRRADLAGLARARLRGLVSDGAAGLEAYRRATLPWVSHQRCVFHLWRGLAGELAQQVAAAATGLTGAMATQLRAQVRREMVGLVHAVLDAASWTAAEAALAVLAAHDRGVGLANALRPHLAAALVYQCGYNQGLLRVGPEWCWRDFRRRLSRGRNHASDARLERAALVWALYHNFEPAQGRYERKRHYRHPGQCPLAVAGAPPGPVGYLDALGV
jgi:transposase-like protein